MVQKRPTLKFVSSDFLWARQVSNRKALSTSSYLSVSLLLYLDFMHSTVSNEAPSVVVLLPRPFLPIPQLRNTCANFRGVWGIGQWRKQREVPPTRLHYSGSLNVTLISCFPDTPCFSLLANSLCSYVALLSLEN